MQTEQEARLLEEQHKYELLRLEMEELKQEQQEKQSVVEQLQL
jgi:hypothetical protein